MPYNYGGKVYNTIEERNKAMGATRVNGKWVAPGSSSLGNQPEPVINSNTLLPEDKQKLDTKVSEIGALPQTAEQELLYLKAALGEEGMKKYGIDENKLKGQYSAMTTAGQPFEPGPDMITKPTTTGLSVLQQALQTKADIANPKSVLEEGMAAAGISGHAALPYILKNKSLELDTKIEDLKSKLLTQGQKEADVYSAAMDNYKLLKDEYDTEADRINSLLDKQLQYDNELALQDKADNLTKEGRIIDVAKFLIEQSMATDWNDAMAKATKIVNEGGTITTPNGETLSADDIFAGIQAKALGTQYLPDVYNYYSKAATTNTFNASASYIAGRSKHEAWDLVLPGQKNADVIAPVTGTVEIIPDKYPGKKQGWGNQVIITDAQGNKHKMGHLDSFAVQNGQQIMAGQALGKQGNTGYSIASKGGTGVHVHYEITTPDGKRIDPQEYLKSIGKQSALNKVLGMWKTPKPLEGGLFPSAKVEDKNIEQEGKEKTLTDLFVGLDESEISSLINYSTYTNTKQADIDRELAAKGYTSVGTKIKNGNWKGIIKDPEVLKYTDALSRLIKEDKASVTANAILEITNGNSDYIKGQIDTAIADKTKGISGEYVTSKNVLANAIVLKKTFDTDKTGIIKGNWQKLLEKFGLVGDFDLAEISAEAEQALNKYVHDVSGAQFSIEEFKRYASLFPGLVNGSDLNAAKINAMYNVVNRKLGNIIKSTTGSLSDLRDVIPSWEYNDYIMDVGQEGETTDTTGNISQEALDARAEYGY